MRLSIGGYQSTATPEKYASGHGCSGAGYPVGSPTGACGPGNAKAPWQHVGADLLAAPRAI